MFKVKDGNFIIKIDNYQEARNVINETLSYIISWDVFESLKRYIDDDGCVGVNIKLVSGKLIDWGYSSYKWYLKTSPYDTYQFVILKELISSSETISKKKNIMSSISNLIKKLSRGEPEKTFVEVGFLSDCEEITQDGKDALINILWDKNKTELKELADKIKKVQEEEKK